MVVVAQALSGIVLTRSCSVPETYFIAEFVGDESMYLETEVKTRADTWGDGIEGVGQDG